MKGAPTAILALAKRERAKLCGIPAQPQAAEWADGSTGGPSTSHWREDSGPRLLWGCCRPRTEQTNRRSQGLLETKHALSGGAAGMPGGGPECSPASRGCRLRPLGSPGRGCGALLTSQPAHSPVPPSSHCSRLHFAFFCSGISFSLPFFGFMCESSLLAF